MKRRTSTTPVKVYTYGCLAPVEGGDDLHDQLVKANTYKHALLDIELWKRQEYREARRSLDERVASAEKEVDRIAEMLEGCVKDDRKGILAQLKSARSSLKEARNAVKDNPELKRQSDQINERASVRVRDARANCGVYWGTYLLIEQAHELTRKSKVDPRHRSWDGSGCVGIQIQKGIRTSELFSGLDTRIRIAPLPADTWDTRPGRRRAYSTVHIRIGSEERAPKWAVLPVLLHRPIPDGIIKRAWVKATRIGFRTRYDLQITVESDQFPRHEDGRAQAEHLSLKWDERESGVLVGSLSNGTEYVVPRKLLDKIAHAQSLHGICDLAFVAARDGLRAWMAEHASDVPTWMPEATDSIWTWRRHGRLRSVAVRWVDAVCKSHERVEDLWQAWVAERKSVGLPLYGSWADVLDPLNEYCDRNGLSSVPERMAMRLYWWMKQDTHLTQWECDEIRRAQLHRRELYRIWARKAANTYAAITVDDVDLHSAAESEKGEGVNSTRHAVAPSTLRDAFAMAFGARYAKSASKGATSSGSLNSERECA